MTDYGAYVFAAYAVSAATLLVLAGLTLRAWFRAKALHRKGKPGFRE